MTARDQARRQRAMQLEAAAARTGDRRKAKRARRIRRQLWRSVLEQAGDAVRSFTAALERSAAELAKQAIYYTDLPVPPPWATIVAPSRDAR